MVATGGLDIGASVRRRLRAPRFSRQCVGLAAAAALAMEAVAGTPTQGESEMRRFEIPAQDAAVAFTEFARQADVQMVLPYEAVKGRRTAEISGQYTREQALGLLMAGLDLRTTSNDGSVVTLAAASAPPPPASTGQRDGEQSASQSALEEVLVTAARREQNAQDTPGGLQVFTGASLERRGADGYKDYLLNVPSVSFRDQGTGSKRIALRGISNASGSDFSSGATVSTVGLYIDDVPIQGTSVMADLSLYDLNRIEVLKGPQGTLYGEGAMGGAVKMVLNQPNFNEVISKADVTLSHTEKGAWNQRVRGAVNVPLLENRAAVRIVGTYRSDSGYIDNVATGASDINDEDAYSIRALFAADLTEALSANFLVMADELDMDDFSQVHQNLDDLEIAALEDNRYEVRSNIYALTLKYDFDVAQLSSVSSYYESSRDYLVPYPLASILLRSFSPTPLTQGTLNINELSSFAQEVRLVSAGDHRFDWITGVFFRAKEQDADSEFRLLDAELPVVNAGLATAGRAPYADTLWFERETTDEYEQYAAYAEGNYEITSRVELTAGLRYYHETTKVEDVQRGYGYTAFISTAGFAAEISDSGVIPKVSVTFRANDDQLFYVLASQGFRSSTLNFNVLEAGDEGATSDNLWNYEVGAKTRWADNRLQLNATAFHIRWSDIQGSQIGISKITGLPRPYVENGGNAEIYGGEFELVTAPVEALQAGLSVGYTHSELVDAGASLSTEGAVLPNSPEWTAGGFVEYRFAVFGGAQGFARLDALYSDEQATRMITATQDGFFVDGYATADLRLGLRSGSLGTVTLFVNNLSDERAELGRGLTGASAYVFTDRFAISRPRTVGVTYGFEF